LAYDAFISYSHAADGRLAPALQSGLQRLAKPWYRLRALRVFRDETGLSTNPHLWSSIAAALDESERFVLLASPESASSPWVDKEIAHWLDTKSADRILSVVTSGDWGWDPIACRLVGDAVPERLALALVEEPRHLDLRWAAGETDLDLRNSGFRSAVADLAAPMHGMAKDELEGEDIRQHRRARRLARGAVAVVVALLIVSVIFGGYAVNQRNRARAATREAELGRLVAESRALVAQDRPRALLLAAEAYRRKPEADTHDALLFAVLAERRLQRNFGPTAGVTHAGGLTGTRVVVAANPASVLGFELSVWNWKTGQREAWPAAPHPGAGRGCSSANPVGLATSPKGDLIAVVTADGLLHFFSGRTLGSQGEPEKTGLAPFLACNAQIAFSPNGRGLAVSNGAFNINDELTGKTVALFERTRDGWRPGPPLTGHRIRVDALAFSKDNVHLATGSPAGKDAKTDPGLIVLHDVHTGESTRPIVARDFDPISLALDWDRRRVVAGSLDHDTRVYDLDRPFEPATITGLGTVTQPVYNANRTQLAVSGTDGFRLLDADRLSQIKSPDIKPKIGSTTVVFLPGDQILFAGDHGPLNVWDLNSTSVLETIVSKLASIAPTATPNAFLTSRSSSDGTFMTILGPGPDYRPLKREVRVGSPQIYGPAWCADPHTNRIATFGTGTAADKGEVVVRQGAPPFDVTSRIRGAVDFVPLTCEWRPDGKQIAIGGYYGDVALYQVATRRIQRVPAHLRTPVVSLAYRPDSTELWVASPGGGTGAYPARITNLDGTPRVTTALPAFGRVDALRFTPDGRFLVTATAPSVQVLDARSLKPVTDPIPATTNLIIYIGISADSRTAVISGFGVGMQLVDLRAGRSLGPPVPMAAAPPAVFGRGDTTIYASAPDGGTTVWDLAADHVRDQACALAGRNLTQAEWDRYLPWAGPRHKTCPQFPQG
jgi:WD40 repeat protein